MDFRPSDDRRMLRDSLDRFLADRCPIEHRNGIAYDAPWHDPDLWSGLAELGVLHALVPEGQGGFGGAGFDIATVFEALGAALCPEPVLGALLSARVLGAAGADLEPLLSGATRYALAVNEPGDLFPLEHVACTATPSGGDWRLEGRKSVVYGGGSAHRILVPAQADDTLALFDCAAADLGRTPYGMVDGGNAAELFFRDTPARRLEVDAHTALRAALDAGAVALSAEAVGAMEVTLGMLTDYLATRHQFGRPIGSFQALQHRAVDLAIALEQARSITILAAHRLDTPAGPRAVAMAKSLTGRTARRVAEEAIQMHGGIAMTWEAAVSHYAKRLVMIDHQLGDADHHLARVAAAYGEG